MEVGVKKRATKKEAEWKRKNDHVGKDLIKWI